MSKSNGWKITAIIFIVLFILEGLLFGWFLYLGLNIIEKENECSINICSLYDFYYFDTTERVCYCYVDDEIVYREFIG